MGWDGDISHMGRLAANLRRLGEVPSRVSRRVAGELQTMVEQEFAQGVDPYGRAWEPLAESTLAKGRTPPPLTETGAMRDSFDARPMPGAGVSLTIDHPAAPHQTGWDGPQGSGPARPILPGAAFPARWREAIETATREEIQGALR